MPVINCLEPATINRETSTTMMLPNNNVASYQSLSSPYFNDEIKSSNNNNNNDNNFTTSATTAVNGQSSHQQQHSVGRFDSDHHHYTTIKSTTTTTTSSPSFDDHNGGDCTTTLLANQEKTLNNNNVSDCYTMLDGGGEDLPPPLLLPIIPTASYHQQYPPQQIQLNITVGSGQSAAVQPQTFPIIYDPEQIPKNVFGTYLEIIEQPTNRIRYRYRSEKGSHGGLNGANSSQIKKTYPTIKIENYHHSNPVYIRASLATNDDNPRSHVHKLMGRHCNDDGSCTLAITENMTATFQNLGILFIGKKEVPEILFKRKLLEIRSSYFAHGATFDQREKLEERLREESEKEAKDLNLNSVRLCFEAFMLHNDALYPICPAVYSRPIANQKSPDSGELKIVRINRFCGSVTGGDEIYLLCEKVNKKEIRVRFFEINDTDGSQQWEAFGDFNESDVHHQVAIVFRTPPYRRQTITKPCQVFMQLYRQRDGEYSEPRTFIYKPTKTMSSKDQNTPDMLITEEGNTELQPEEEEMINNNGIVAIGNGDGGGGGGLQECVMTRIRMENLPPGFKRKKYGARHHYQEQKSTANNPSASSTSSANSLSSACSSPSCLSSSSSSSSPTSMVFKNGQQPHLQPSNYPDGACSMDVPLNSSSIPKHSNLAHADFVEHLNPMWTAAVATTPSEPMPMIVVNDFCCGQNNNNNNNDNNHQNIYLNGNNMANGGHCVQTVNTFPMMMNMQQSSSSSSSLMATVTATATSIASPATYSSHQIYAAAAADDHHTGGNQNNNNNLVSTLYSL